MIVRAVGYNAGDLVDPRVDLVAAAPFHFVVLLPPGDVFLQEKDESMKRHILVIITLLSRLWRVESTA